MRWLTNPKNVEPIMKQHPNTTNETPMPMVVAPVSLRCGSSMDSIIPLPQRAVKISINGRSRDGEVIIVPNLKR